MRWPKAAVEAALASEWGRSLRVTKATPLAGGDINQAARLDTTEGPVFLKWNQQNLLGLFSAEAAGLTALRESGTRLTVPEVIAHEDPTEAAPGFLLMSFLEDGPAATDFDEAVGIGLAELHTDRRDTFGFPVDNYIGTTTQPNPKETEWVPFYRQHRIGHQVRLARDAGLLSSSDARACDQLGERLSDLLIEGRPSLVHGDLWAGNLHRHRGQPALIDPAAYYGHPEAELGMMTLFGGFSQATYAAYADASGLDANWRERNPLYQLYHLLNHANLFGGGYAAQSMRIVHRFIGR